MKPEGTHPTNSTNRAQENSQNLGFCIIKMIPVVPEKRMTAEERKRDRKKAHSQCLEIRHSSMCTCQQPSLAKLSPTVMVGTNEQRKWQGKQGWKRKSDKHMDSWALLVQGQAVRNSGQEQRLSRDN